MNKLLLAFCLVLFALPAWAQPSNGPFPLAGQDASGANVTANGTTTSLKNWLSPFFATPNTFSLSRGITNASGANFGVFGTLSGSGGTSPPLNNFSENYFQITGDSLAYTGNNYASTMHLDHNFGSPSMTGNRANLDLSMIMEATTGNTGNVTQEYVGLADYVQCGYNDNGTAGFANAAGDCVGFNSIVNLSGTYWYILNGEEIDVIANSGSSSAHTIGTLWVREGAGPRGTYDDAALVFSASNGASWGNIIQIGKTDGPSATSSTTNILECVSMISAGTPCPIKNGIDLRNFSGSGGSYPFSSPGFIVDWSGNITPNSIISSAITAPGAPVASLTVTAGGGIYTSFPTLTIAAPASGVQATGVVATMSLSSLHTLASGGAGYSTNDILTLNGNGTCSSPMEVYVSAQTSGVITAVSGYSPGSCSILPTGTINATGGTGTGATFSALGYYVNTASVTLGGSGYLTIPSVTITGGGGSGATATASLGSGDSLTLSASEGITATGPILIRGANFTTTGCSISATVGGVSAGALTSGTTGTCTPVITMTGATAPNGWACWMNDETTPADVMHQTAHSTTTATFSGTTVSGDVLSFGCIGY